MKLHNVWKGLLIVSGFLISTGAVADSSPKAYYYEDGKRIEKKQLNKSQKMAPGAETTRERAQREQYQRAQRQDAYQRRRASEVPRATAIQPGQRVDRRLDQKTPRAVRSGEYRRADGLDRRGNRIEGRMDKRGERTVRRVDKKQQKKMNKQLKKQVKQQKKMNKQHKKQVKKQKKMDKQLEKQLKQQQQQQIYRR